MDKIFNSEFYEHILDDTNQLIQISDTAAFSMMYANKTARTFTDHSEQPYRGEKCYKYMMGLDEQCPFCPMRQMTDDMESFVTEIDNGQQVFTVKTKRAMWDGKEAFIEYATDITTTKRAQQIFEFQMQTLIKSIPEAQGIFHINLTQDKWLSSNGTSHNVDKMKDISDVNSTIKSICSFIPDKVKAENVYDTFSRESLIKAYQSGQTEVVEETQSYYDDGSIRWARLTARMNMNPQTGDLECIFYGMDINDEKMYQEQATTATREREAIIEKSKRDMLTGVYSKKAFEQLSNEYITANPEQHFAIVFLDMDNFKSINDTLGHLAGDNVIIDVSNKLQTIFSNKDVISRFGGDEFCILVKDLPLNTLIRKLDFMLQKLSAAYGEEILKVSITASIGVVYCAEPVKDILPIIHKADRALYKAKRNGRNQYCIVQSTDEEN